MKIAIEGARWSFHFGPYVPLINREETHSWETGHVRVMRFGVSEGDSEPKTDAIRRIRIAFINRAAVVKSSEKRFTNGNQKD